MMGSQSEESMNDTLQKASLISEQKQTRSRPNSSLILRHTVQSPASMPLLSALSGSAARKAALLRRRAQVELRVWVGLCTANVLFWSRVCGEACLVGTADKTRCGSFQMTATVTESAMRWAK